MTVRIAYIDHTGEMGGAEHLLLQLLTGLTSAPTATETANPVAPILICGRDGLFPQKALERGIPTVILPLPKLASFSLVLGHRKILNPFAVVSNLVQLLRASRQLGARLRDTGVDLVQTNTTFAHLYGGLAARLTGIPAIWYFHDLVESRRLGGVLSLIWRLLARLLATRIVCVSEAVRQALAAGERSMVIYAGVEEPPPQTPRDLRAELGLPADSLLVGFIGRIGYVKALEVLARAAQTIVSQNPSVHVVIVGDSLFGEQDYKARIAAQVQALGLSAHWHAIGYVENVPALIGSMDIIVLPSRREALPLILVEAALAKKPVVASRVGGIPEIVQDGETGILIAPADERELTDAIVRLLDDPGLRARMGEQAHERAVKMFTAPRYYAEFTHLYQTLV